MKELIGIILIAAIIFLFVAVIFIWCVNTLFTLSIAYSIKNIFASAILCAILSGGGQ